MRVDSAGKLLLGLGTGVVFGALLQKGQASKYDVIIDQLTFKDGRIARIMATAVAVGGACFQLLKRRGLVKQDVKPLQLGGVAGGAALFGAGLALFGYCPGTSLAAAGEGRLDALAGVLGMIAGGALFVRFYPMLAPAIEAGDIGKATIPASTRTSPWPWITAIGAAVAAQQVAKELK